MVPLPIPDDPNEADLAAGAMVGEYRIERKLGEGGFGSVYQAIHPIIGKAAAVKVLNRQCSSSPEMVSRFVAEARAVNQIRHRNIIDIFSFGALADGRQYYVMELLEGTPLDELIEKRGPLPPETAIPLLLTVARALDAAHAAGIAHRDLKPANIFVMFDEDGRASPKLLDFGIAKLLVDTALTHKTQTGAPLGTPLYMSPEQCRGKNVDHRTDIYSFGVLAHVTLTGQPLFNGDSVMDVLVQHTHAAPPKASAVCPALPGELDAPILRMLEKDPDARPPSILEAARALAEAAVRAGHNIPGVALARPDGRGAAAGPAGVDEPQAIAQTGGQGTLRGSSAEVTSPLQRRTALVGLAAGALTAGILAAILVRPAPQPPGEEGADTTPVAGDSAPAAADRSPPDLIPATAPAPTAPPAASAAAEPAPETVEIAIDIQVGPKNAAVYLGTERLGQAPGPFRLKRGDGTIKLTVRADGYVPRDLEVTPDGDHRLSATLVKIARARATTPATNPTPGHDDLENPF